MTITEVTFVDTIRLFGMHVSALGAGVARDKTGCEMTLQPPFLRVKHPKFPRPRLIPLLQVSSIEIEEGQAPSLKVAKVDKEAQTVSFEASEPVALDLELDEGDDGAIIPEREAAPVVADKPAKRKPGRPKSVNG